MSEKSGKAFIAYKGTEFSVSEIKARLNLMNTDSGYTVKSCSVQTPQVVLAKIVYDSYTEDRDPHRSSDGVITVNGYLQSEMAEANGRFRDVYEDDADRKQRITNHLYRREGTKMFQMLKPMHFSCAIYDRNKDAFIAGVTENNGDMYTSLYYGYTKQNGEIMFSNVKGALETFCDGIHQMPENTYMMNGELYDLDGNLLKSLKRDQPLIPKDKKNVDSLFDGLNGLLMQVTTEAVRDKIEQNVDDYLDSDDPKKQIEDYLTNELDAETRKKVLQIIKDAVEESRVENDVRSTLQDVFNQELEEYKKNTNIPVVHILKLEDTVLGQTQGGFYHEKFEEVLSLVQLEEPIMLIGPAGSGKNHAIGQIAESLGLHMYYTNNASNEFKLTGFIDAGGTYRDTEFYKAFKNGGIFFLDEIDNSDPSALIVINSALANGYMAFPHETIEQHKDFRMVAAANTWGKGSDLQYVGRNALDGATLDRFDNVYFDYDRKLEEALYPNEEVLKFMWGLRDAVNETKTLHIVSTRGIGKVYKKEINNIPTETILRTNIVRNLGQDDWNTLLGSMRNVPSNNKYYQKAKTLTLTR